MPVTLANRITVQDGNVLRTRVSGYSSGPTLEIAML